MGAVLVVCCATASGKTAFAVRMAQRLKSEVVSADCMLVYKGLNIGTAKPSEEERGGIVHHLMDVADPSESFSVSDYERLALPVCKRLLGQRKVPVVCGGTGFYIQALLFARRQGGVGADPVLREKYERLAREQGKEALHDLLASVDADSAEKLHPNDVRRVVRALEIYELTGRKKSEQDDGFVPRFPYLAVAFDFPREELYARADARVDEMLAAGLVDEVHMLSERVKEDSQCLQGIGYKEVVEYLNGNCSYSTMRDVIKQNTRNYAKRQITFFKKLPGIVWLDPKADDNEKKVEEMLCRIQKN